MSHSRFSLSKSLSCSLPTIESQSRSAGRLVCPPRGFLYFLRPAIPNFQNGIGASQEVDLPDNIAPGSPPFTATHLSLARPVLGPFYLAGGNVLWFFLIHVAPCGGNSAPLSAPRDRFDAGFSTFWPSVPCSSRKCYDPLNETFSEIEWFPLPFLFSPSCRRPVPGIGARFSPA